MSDNKDAFDRGLNLRREMFGVAGADKAIESASDFAKPLQEMVTRFCFGEVWQRPGLDRKTRSLLTLSMLIGSGRMLQFPAHVRGALANGVTKEELRSWSCTPNSTVASRWPWRLRRYVNRCSTPDGRSLDRRSPSF